MDDYISRQAAIETVKKHYRGIDNDLLEIIAYEMEELPPAQPDHIGEVTEMVGDVISRQGVLRLLNAVPSEEFATKAMLISGVNALPSAQPEWTTDVNDILAYLDGVVHPLVSPENWNVYSELYDMVSGLLKPWEGEQDENN